MNCKHIRRRLSAYQDSELDEATRRAVEEHLQHCASCLAEYERMVRVYEMLEMGDEPVPDPQFLVRLKARLHREKSRTLSNILPEKWISRVLVPSTAMAGLLIGAILGLRLIDSLEVTRTDISQFSTQYVAEELLMDVPIHSITFAYNSAIDYEDNAGGSDHE